MLYADGLHDDTLAIQQMLDKRGIVTIETPGTYLITKTLIIHSNTRFVLSPGAHLILGDNTRCSIIQNEGFATGNRDENIEIVGGIWDGNCDGQGLDAVYEAEHREDQPYSVDLFKGKLIRFAHINNLFLQKMTVKNPVSYGIQIADAVGFTVRDMYFDYNWHFGTADGVHINGPSYNGVIENCYGTTNDDMVALTTIDELHAEVSKGEIVNVTIRNVRAKNGFSGIRLLSAGDCPLREVYINGVYGDYRHNAVLVSHHYTRPNTPIWFDDIIIENVSASKTVKPLPDDCFTLWENNVIEELPLIWVEEGVNCGNMAIRNIRRVENAVTNGALIQIDKTAKIERLIIENVSQKILSDCNPPLIINEGTIDNYIEEKVER